MVRSEIVRDEGFAAYVPDALDADDDPAILAGLRSDGEAFAAAPSLPGRASERRLRAALAQDGLLRRRRDGAAGGADDRSTRMSRPALARRGGRGNGPGRGAWRRLAAREGFAAVETSRGRLGHWTRLSRDGKIEDYAIVAPTEWNFHPAGPFVAAVLGARVSKATAAASISRLAGLFDPCVLYRVEVMEPAHA